MHQHVGAFLSNLECFNNSAFFNVVCVHQLVIKEGSLSRTSESRTSEPSFRLKVHIVFEILKETGDQNAQ